MKRKAKCQSNASQAIEFALEKKIALRTSNHRWKAAELMSDILFALVLGFSYTNILLYTNRNCEIFVLLFCQHTHTTKQNTQEWKTVIISI